MNDYSLNQLVPPPQKHKTNNSQSVCRKRVKDMDEETRQVYLDIIRDCDQRIQEAQAERQRAVNWLNGVWPE